MNIRRIKKCFLSLNLLILVLLLGGCRQTAVPSLESMTMDICDGYIYEITENEFQEGLDHTFSQQELQSWQKVLTTAEYQAFRETLDKKNIKYIIDLYDQEGNELLSLALDQDKKIYTEDDYRIESETLNKMLQKIIAE